MFPVFLRRQDIVTLGCQLCDEVQWDVQPISALFQGQREKHFHSVCLDRSLPRVQVHTMVEESATACVAGEFPQALEKAKEAVSTASLSAICCLANRVEVLAFLGGKPTSARGLLQRIHPQSQRATPKTKRATNEAFSREERLYCCFSQN